MLFDFSTSDFALAVEYDVKHTLYASFTAIRNNKACSSILRIIEQIFVTQWIPVSMNEAFNQRSAIKILYYITESRSFFSLFYGGRLKDK